MKKYILYYAICIALNNYFTIINYSSSWSDYMAHAYIVCTNVCNMYVCSGPRPRQQIVIKNKMYVTMQIFFSAGINLEYTSRPFFHFDMSFFLYSSPRFQSNFNHICSNQINSLCRFDMSRFLAARTQNNKASNRQIMIFICN